MMITDVLNKKDALSYKLLIFSLTLLGIIVGAGWFATDYLGDRARKEIIRDNESAISLLSTSLTSELKKVEGSVKSLSGSPWIAPALISRKDHDIMNANSVLDRYKAAMDASYAYLMDNKGMVIASSNRNDPNSLVGKSLSYRSYFMEAIKGSQGRFFALGIYSMTRGFYASYPVRDNKGGIIGVAVIKKDLDEIEVQMGSYDYCFFINRHGIIFLSSKKEMVLKSLWPISQETERELLAAKQFGEKPFEAVMSQEVADRMNITYKGNNYLVSRTTIDPEGWSVVLMTPTDRILIYKSIGVIVTLLIGTLLMIPLIVSYRTARSAEMARESEERFHRLADSTFEGILIHDKGEILDFNQALLQMFDYAYDDVIGTSVMDYVAPESREVTLHHLQTGYENPYEVVLRRKDGATRTMEVAGKSISYKGKTARVVALRDVTERKQAVEALKESMEKYQRFFMTSRDCVFITSKEGSWIDMNDAAVELFGYSSRDELMQVKITDLYVNPEERTKHSSVIAEHGYSKEFPVDLLKKDGTVMHTLITAVALCDAEKNVIGFQGTIRDITELKEAEESFRQAEAEYRSIFENAQEGIFQTTPDGQFITANQSMANMLGYDSPRELCSAITDIPRQIYVNPEDREALKQMMKEYGPIKGYETQHYRKDGIKIWVSLNIHHVSDAEGKVNYYEGMIEDITEQKGMEKERRESEQKYRNLFNNAGDAIFIMKGDRFVDCNEATLKIYGCTREQIIGNYPYIFSPPLQPDSRDSKEKALEKINKALSGEPQFFEWLHCRYDGTPFHAEVSLNHMKMGDETVLQAIVRDITERKQAEEALRESETRYRTFFEATGTAIIIIEEDTTISLINAEYEKLTGYAKEEVEGKKSWTEFVVKEDLARMQEYHRARRIEGKEVPRNYEFRFVNRDGGIKDAFLTVSMIPGTKKSVASIIDISARKKAEESLQQSEKKYRTLVENAHEGICVIQDGMIIFMNPRLAKASGYSMKEALSRSFLDFIYPDDVPMVIERYMKRVAGEEVSRVFYARFVSRDGRIAWVEVVGATIEWEGKPAFLYFINDITDRKRAEDLYKTLAESSLAAVFIIQDEKFRFINTSAIAYAGYDAEELIGRYSDTIVYPEDRELVKKKGREMLRGKDTTPFEFRMVTKEGQIRWIMQIVSPIQYEGKPAILGNAIDITARRVREEERTQSFERLRKALGATIKAMAVTVETRDPYTAGHQRRVADLARAIATEMNLTGDQIDGLRMASVIHDIGKISVPAEILSKPTKLTDIEFSLIKIHSQAGYDILKDIEFPWPIARIVLEHHERMNGSGYPNGLTGENLLVESRILAVADVVEAIASHRPYRPGLGIDAALDEIAKNKGALYDPEVADACLKLLREKGYTLHA